MPIVRFQPKLTCCAISYALEYRRPINSLLRRQKENPYLQHGASLVAQMVKNLPELGRSPRGRNGNPLKYSCLENSTDRGAWWATVHGVTKGHTLLSN